MSKGRFTPDQIRQAHQMRKEGATWKALGQHFECDPDTIRKPLDPKWDEMRKKQINAARSGKSKVTYRTTYTENPTPRRERKTVRPLLPFRPGRLPEPTPVSTTPLNLTLLELQTRQCKFPVNNAGIGETHLFCGCPVKEDSVYCKAHYEIAYRKREPGVRYARG